MGWFFVGDLGRGHVGSLRLIGIDGDGGDGGLHDWFTFVECG